MQQIFFQPRIHLVFFVFFYSMFFPVSFSFFSCRPSSPYPGYSLSPNGLYYKIEAIGDGNINAAAGDYVTAQIIIKLKNDSVLADTRRFGPDGATIFKLTEPAFQKDYREGFLFLSEGDSASFITDVQSFYTSLNKLPVPPGMKPLDEVWVFTKVLKIRSETEYAREQKEYEKWLEKGEFEEKKILEKHFQDSAFMNRLFDGRKNLRAETIGNGLYYIMLQNGYGTKIDSGEVAYLNYRGYFLNGNLFDSTYDTQPFEYFSGAEDQLIRGLEIGIKKMREGEKAKFIIPSHLAFGSEGSSTGMVPPFTTVVYEVELLKVQ